MCYRAVKCRESCPTWAVMIPDVARTDFKFDRELLCIYLDCRGLFLRKLIYWYVKSGPCIYGLTLTKALLEKTLENPGVGRVICSV